MLDLFRFPWLYYVIGSDDGNRTSVSALFSREKKKKNTSGLDSGQIHRVC